MATAKKPTAFPPRTISRPLNYGVEYDKSKKDAVRRRLDNLNAAARGEALKNKKTTYKSSYVRGADEGFVDSDFGEKKGAAIPYQIGTKNASTRTATRPTLPVKPPRSAREVRPRG
jgi:hypothetical protein